MSKTTNNMYGLVIGAGGAIGAAISHQLTTELPRLHLHATHRVATSAMDNFTSWHALDLLDARAIGTFLERMLDELTHLDYLVCATGVLHAQDVAPEKKAADWTPTQFQKVMWINAGAPLTLLTGLSPLLKKSGAPKALFLSAQIGSIGDNESGGWYSYRMSKAALNMGIKTAAIEAARWRNNASIIAAHPGTTRSGLSRPFTARRRNLLDPKRSAADLTQLLLNLTPDQSGTFTDRQGNPLPW